MSGPEDLAPRLLTRPMRILLVVAGVLVFLAGVQLFVFPLRTDRFFAWTIAPPMTAVFLGASYWSALAFEWSAAAQRRWSDARIAIPTVFVFTTLTLVATLVHIRQVPPRHRVRDRHPVRDLGLARDLRARADHHGRPVGLPDPPAGHRRAPGPPAVGPRSR